MAKRSDQGAGTTPDFSAIVNALPGMVWTTQIDGRANFFNRSWREYSGLSSGDALDLGWQQAIHPDDLRSFLESWSVITQSGVAREIDARLRRFDGEYRWFVFNASLIPGTGSGNLQWCWLGVCSDESDSLDGRMRRFFDILPWQAGFLNTAGVSEFSNLQALRDFNMTQEELAQWTTSGIIHVDDHERNVKAAAALLATGKVFDEQIRMLYPTGVYRWTRARCVPVRDAQGNVVRYVSFQIDVDDLKRAEDLLAAEVKLLERVARGEPLAQVLQALGHHVEELCRDCFCSVLAKDSSWKDSQWPAQMQPQDYASCWSTRIRSGSGEPSGVITVYLRQAAGPTTQEQELVDRFTKIAGIAIDRAQADAEQRRVNMQLTDAHRLSRTGSFTWDVLADEHTWTEEIFRLFEFDPAVKINRNMMLEAIHPEDRPAMESLLGRAVEGTDFELGFRVVPRSGSVKHAQVVGRRIGLVTDRPVFMGALQDVTANKLAQEALNRARMELAHVERITTLSAMTASITHEVSQPIAGILTNASTLVRMLTADQPNLVKAAETARRTIRDANRASEVIKRLRAMFTKKAPTIEVVDLNDAAREVVALSSGELQRAHAVLQTHFADDLPVVSGDRVQLQQVILNLVLNAVDAMSRVEDRPRTLLIRTESHDQDSVKLLVRDSGVGVDPNAVEKLFNAFYTTKAHGMGVGLAISRSIIESHKGRLWAAANDGPGATFGFNIPRAAGAVHTGMAF